MRRLLQVAVVFLLTSCLSEDSVQPGTSASFIRYYNGGNNDEARGLELAPDGFVILATTRIQKTETDAPVFKVKVIKTDAFGNPVWQALYPPIGENTLSYVAGGIAALPNDAGYVIVADQGTGASSQVVVFTINPDGVVQQSTTTSTTGVNAKAVNLTSTGNFLVLFTSGTTEMFLLEVDKTTLDPVSLPQLYEAGDTQLANRLLMDEDGKAIWSGDVTKNGRTGIRLIRTIPNNINTDFDLLISEPDFTERGRDISPFGNDFAVIGSTNRKVGLATPSPDTDILFMRVSKSGNVLVSTSFSLDDPLTTENEDTQNDEGKAISSTRDGGLILLSSVGSLAIDGRGDLDYYLIKLDAFGNEGWTSSFGSKFKDEAVAVRQTVDEGYVVLGTTTQGALKILSLMKTDKNGKIE